MKYKATVIELPEIWNYNHVVVEIENHPFERLFYFSQDALGCPEDVEVGDTGWIEFEQLNSCGPTVIPYWESINKKKDKIEKD